MCVYSITPSYGIPEIDTPIANQHLQILYSKYALIMTSKLGNNEKEVEIIFILYHHNWQVCVLKWTAKKHQYCKGTSVS